MPVLASGDMGCSRADMVEAIVDAASHWMVHGLPLERLQIVMFDQTEVEDVQVAFEAAKQAWVSVAPRHVDVSHDVFVSYAHEDGLAAADLIVERLAAADPSPRVFVDRHRLEPGMAWQQEIDDSLNACRVILALLTPGYFLSKPCQEELHIARYRRREGTARLHPVYVLSADLPAHLAVLHYEDCREGDRELLTRMCAGVLASLNG